MGTSFMLGTIYTFSHMYIYVSHYLRTFDPKLDKDGRDVLLVMPIWMITLSIFSILSVRIADRIGYWALSYIAFLWFSLNNFAAIFVTNYYLFIFVYGFCNGMALGLGYLPALYISWTYFPEKKSVATGCILFSSGISFFFMSPLISYLVNPDDLIDDHEEVQRRVPYMFSTLTTIFTSLTLVCSSLQPSPWVSFDPTNESQSERDQKKKRLIDFLQKATQLDIKIDINRFGRQKLADEVPNAEVGVIMAGQLPQIKVNDITLVPDYIPEMNCSSVNAKAETTDKRSDSLLSADLDEEIKRISMQVNARSCPSLRKALTSLPLYHISFLAVCMALYLQMMLESWHHNFKHAYDIRSRHLSYLLSLGSIGNATGKLFCGLIMVKLSFRTVYLTSIFIMAVTAFSFPYVLGHPDLKHIGYAYLFLAFFVLGMMLAMFPTGCMKTFGISVGSRVYPFIYLMFSICTLNSYLIIKLLTSVSLTFYLLGSVCTFGFISAFFFNEKHEWLASESNKQEVELK